MEIIKYSDFLEESYLESNRSPLYHWTYSFYLNFILREDALKIRDNSATVNITGISFTRNVTYQYNIIKEDADVRLVFDFNKLAADYKIEPFDYFSYDKSPNNTKSNFNKRSFDTKKPFEFEEIVRVSAITNLGKYMTEIQFLNMNAYNKTEQSILLYNIKYPDIKLYMLDKNLINKHGID